MKHPLCVAITLALTLLAGCSAPPSTTPGADKSATAVNQPAKPVKDDARGQGQERQEVDEDKAGVVIQEPTPSIAPQAPVAKVEARMADWQGGAVASEAAAMPALNAPIPGAQMAYASAIMDTPVPSVAGENYAKTPDNPVVSTLEQPVSTFSIDVDTGSYANIRRMLVSGVLPPADSVRAEEMINYFDYGYLPPATPAQPFSVTTELARAPWDETRHLLMVGVKGYEVAPESIPAANLVFLIDTSGSMQAPDKIDLLRASFQAMVEHLRPQDTVAIVAYAGSAGLVLPPTEGRNKDRIVQALDQLSAGGSTNGGEGIALAYATAREAFKKGGINRVILATDGDFNVGTVSVEALKDMVAQQRESGIALTTLGFGAGNYNDEMSEQLADVGNGNHAYIDTLQEGRKVLVDEVSSTMMTIAQDVKIQVVFDPESVANYRLVGYVNRQLAQEDFDNDQVDAGEIGAGHDVTALYELTLKGGDKDLGVLRLRHKVPGGTESALIEHNLDGGVAAPSERLRFAASVAAFADALDGGQHLGNWKLSDIMALAEGARGEDIDGYRAEFVNLVARAQELQGPETSEVAIAD